jgi:translation initiation factor IF-3
LSTQVRINNQIRASELRVIGPAGENFGVITLAEALAKAKEADLDLIEISPSATPPIAKIMDFGKYQYAENKKQKVAKAKSHTVETKSIQIKVGTSEHDLGLKAKQVSQWLEEGHRAKINLFLGGRSKYLDEKFLRERMDRIFKLVSIPHKITETPQKSPKGMTAVIERDRAQSKDTKEIKSPESKVSVAPTQPKTAGTGQKTENK